MPKKNHIIALIGMSGAGKSTIGQALAKKLGISFYDSDKVLEKNSGLSPREIFEQKGEKEFRRLEKKAVFEILDLNAPCVLSTGGGAPVQPEIAARLFGEAFTIWLNVEEDELWERQKDHADKRPMLKGNDPRQKLHFLLEDRIPVYAGAEITIENTHLNPDEVVAQICAALPTHVCALQTG